MSRTVSAVRCSVEFCRRCAAKRVGELRRLGNGNGVEVVTTRRYGWKIQIEGSKDIREGLLKLGRQPMPTPNKEN